MLYTWNSYSDECQLYLDKTGKKKKTEEGISYYEQGSGEKTNNGTWPSELQI